MQELLLVCMSIIDCMSSITWSLSATPNEESHDPVGLRSCSAKGNQKSCKAQEFFVQLGFTTAFHNLALAVCCMLVVSFGWSDARINKHKVCFLQIPFTVGLALATAGMPFCSSVAFVCYVVPENTMEGIFLVGINTAANEDCSAL